MFQSSVRSLSVKKQKQKPTKQGNTPQKIPFLIKMGQWATFTPLPSMMTKQGM